MVRARAPWCRIVADLAQHLTMLGRRPQIERVPFCGMGPFLEGLAGTSFKFLGLKPPPLPGNSSSVSIPTGYRCRPSLGGVFHRLVVTPLAPAPRPPQHSSTRASP